MTTNETLKKICDMIWYTPKFEYQEYDWLYSEFTWYWEYYKWYDMTRIINPVEIIFDPVFKEKLQEYISKNIVLKTTYEDVVFQLWDKHLHDPTSYLANILWLLLKLK